MKDPDVVLSDNSISISAKELPFILTGGQSNITLVADVIFMTDAVGIGTGKPQAPLHVHGNEILSSGPAAGYAFLDRHSPNARWIWYAQDGAARLYTDGGGVQLTVDVNGNIGVGSLWVTMLSGNYLLGDHLIVNNTRIDLRSPRPIQGSDKHFSGKLFLMDSNTGNLLLSPEKSFPDLTIGTDVIVEGNIKAAGTLTQGSSRAIKDRVESLSAAEAAATLSALDPVKYTYKAEEDARPHAGFIADDMPELVVTRDRTAVAPLDIVAVLTRVLKEQQETIAKLREDVDRLTANSHAGIELGPPGKQAKPNLNSDF